MSDEAEGKKESLLIESSRFGQFEVPADSVITLPAGLIGFPRQTAFVMLEHRHPFFWLHAVDEPSLAFVVVDGSEILPHVRFEPPYGDKDTDLQKSDEFATLIVVTVRSHAAETTANLKAPVFVNLRNRRGVQVIYDDPNLTTRYPLFEGVKEAQEAAAAAAAAEATKEEEKK